MKKLLFLALGLFLYQMLPAQNEAVEFPQSWEGVYTGTLEIYGPRGLAQSLPMELHILPIADSENYTWTIIYGEDKEAGARNYILEPTDPSTGLYTIDEQNTIKIEGYLRGNMYVQVFTVMDSQIIAMAEKTADGIIWEIVANQTEPVSTTGNSQHEGEDIPEVQTFPVSAYQRAVLQRSE